MNQRGEVTLLGCLIAMGLLSIVILCSLELASSYKKLQKRTHLILCARETQGEIQEFVTFMGRANWGIKNLNKLSLLMIFIPGLSAAGGSAQKAKKILQRAQDLKLALFLKNIYQMKRKSCPLEPHILMTPYKLGKNLFDRSPEGAVVLRKIKWSYTFIQFPYFLILNIDSSKGEALTPIVKTSFSERRVNQFSPLSASF